MRDGWILISRFDRTSTPGSSAGGFDLGCDRSPPTAAAIVPLVQKSGLVQCWISPLVKTPKPIQGKRYSLSLVLK